MRIPRGQWPLAHWTLAAVALSTTAAVEWALLAGPASVLAPLRDAGWPMWLIGAVGSLAALLPWGALGAAWGLRYRAAGQGDVVDGAGAVAASDAPAGRVDGEAAASSTSIDTVTVTTSASAPPASASGSVSASGS